MEKMTKKEKKAIARVLLWVILIFGALGIPISWLSLSTVFYAGAVAASVYGLKKVKA